MNDSNKVQGINIPWTEKYRPRTLEDYIFPLDFTDQQKEYIKRVYNDKSLDMNFIFHGRGGTGKSTLAQILIRTITPNQSDYKYIRGRTITEIDEIKKWLPRLSLSSKVKLVVIEEADRISDKAYAELKSIIEEANYKYKTYFILLTNKLNKIKQRDEALIQRFMIFNFSRLPIDEVYKYLKRILDSENVKYNESELKQYAEFAVNKMNWSLRETVKYLQLLSYTGQFVFNDEIAAKYVYQNIKPVTDFESDVVNKTISFIELLLNIDDPNAVRDLLTTTSLSNLKHNYRNSQVVLALVELYEQIRDTLIQHYSSISFDNIITELLQRIENVAIKSILLKYQSEFQFSRDKVITYLSMLYEFINYRYELMNLVSKELLTFILSKLNH